MTQYHQLEYLFLYFEIIYAVFLSSVHHPVSYQFFMYHWNSFFMRLRYFIISSKKLCVFSSQLHYHLRVCHLLILSYNYKCKYSC